MKRVFVLLLSVLLCVSAIGLVACNESADSRIPEIVEIIVEKTDEDTRSQQYIDIFAQIIITKEDSHGYHSFGTHQFNCQQKQL